MKHFTTWDKVEKRVNIPYALAEYMEKTYPQAQEIMSRVKYLLDHPAELAKEDPRLQEFAKLCEKERAFQIATWMDVIEDKNIRLGVLYYMETHYPDVQEGVHAATRLAKNPTEMAHADPYLQEFARAYADA